MADNAWSWSTCNSTVQWYGIPGQGSWYWTARFGQYFVGGSPFQWYSWQGYECGALGPPVKPYGFISEFGNGMGSEGIWFLGGAIVFRYDTRRWTTYYGNWGQTAGRLTDEPVDVSDWIEVEGAPPGDWSTLEKYKTPKAPKLTAEMKRLAG